jgi:glycosyltransferase involved in cell wall biosynthesis
MKILYFSRDYTTHDYRFLAALAETEHHVYFLRLEKRGHCLENRPVPPQIEVVNWGGGKKPASFGNAFRLFCELRQILRRLKPDIVHAGPIQRSALLAALAGARPLISMSWGYDLIADAERNKVWQWATCYTLRHSNLLIGDSVIVRQLAQRYGISSERIITFPWGVDLKHFSPGANSGLVAEKVTGEEYFTLLSTRTWEPLYDVETVARAFVLVAQRLPQLRLVMLGSGPQAELLRNIFVQGGVEQRVLMPGQISYKDLPKFYRSADLYLSASRSDGASISLLEALACGTPALVSDIPGNREWVNDVTGCGWRFPLGDANALADSIEYAAVQSQSLADKRQAARRIAEERADWPKNFKLLLQAYQEIVTQK